MGSLFESLGMGGWRRWEYGLLSQRLGPGRVRVWVVCVGLWEGPLRLGGSLLSLSWGWVCVTGRWRLRGLPLEPADSVVFLVASLSGQNLASVHDLYKREATCEYCFGFVFSPSGMSSHPYLTRLAVALGSASPPADQRPSAAQREAPPNSDGKL